MTKRSVLLQALSIGLVSAVGRAVYLQVTTFGMSEHVLTVNYGSEWITALPLSVAYWFIFGFLARGTLGFLMGPKSFTEKI